MNGAQEIPIFSQSPPQSQETVAEQVAVAKEVGGTAFSNVNRSIDESELTNPVVGKILIDLLYELKSENTKLKLFVDKFYDADKRAAVLQEKTVGEGKYQTIYTFCQTAGGAIFGIGFSIQNNALVALAVILIGVLLIAAGLLTNNVVQSYFAKYKNKGN